MKHYGKKFQLIKELIKKNDPLIIEIGAHFGEDTLRLLETFPNAEIHCFEPDSRNYAIFEKLEEWAKENPPVPKTKQEFPEIVGPLKADEFLISALPMTIDVDTLVDSYSRASQGKKAHEDKEINACVYHDIANYEIPLGLSKEEFFAQLQQQFFAHPFIQRINEFIPTDQYIKANPEARHHFGLLKEWIRDNCHDVPIPSGRELTVNVQVLQEWFVKLGGGEYVKDVPGRHSERIFKIEGFKK